jgi:hypothetical protein
MLASPRDGAISYNSFAPGRFLHYNAKLGFHAPRLALPKRPSGALSQQDVIGAYAKALATFRNILFAGQPPDPALSKLDKILSEPTPGEDKETSDLRQFFTFAIGIREGLIPLDLFLSVMLVPPEKIYYISSVEEAMMWDIEIYGFAPPEHISKEMLALGCLNAVNVKCVRGRGHTKCLDFRNSRTKEFDNFLRTYKGFSGIGVYDEKMPLWYTDGNFKNRVVTSFPFDVLARLDAKIEKDAGFEKTLQISDTFNGYTVQVFALSFHDISRKFKLPDFCKIRAKWDENDRFFQMEIDVFNGRDLQFDTFDHWNYGQSEFNFRVWKMLPAGLKLSELGSWSWSKSALSSENFFSKATDLRPQ